MKVTSKYHGDIKVEQKDIWHFKNGMPGFPDDKDFILLPLPDNQVFTILQSIQNSEIAFVLTNPFLFYKEYEFKIDDDTLDLLDLKTEKDVLVFVILNVKDPFEDTTANLLAPLIFNQRNQQAKQIILHDSKYKSKHPIIEKAKG